MAHCWWGGQAGRGSVVFVPYIKLTLVKAGVLLTGCLLERAVPQQHLVSDDLSFLKIMTINWISNRKHDQSNYFLLDDVMNNKGFPIFAS